MFTEESKKEKNCKAIAYGHGKEAILQTAIDLFSSKGYKQTTLKDISAACGMNSALISYYFGGKSGLLESALEVKLQRFKDLFADIAEAGPEVCFQQFYNFIEIVLEDCEKVPSLLHISRWSMIDKEERSAKMTQEMFNRIEEKIAQVFQYLNPKISKAEALSRVIMIGSLIQKHSELYWSYPIYRNFSVPLEDIQKSFKKQALKSLEQIIFS